MFVLVTVNDEKYKPLAEWTVHKNRKLYCEKHGYTLYHLEDGAESIIGKPVRAGNPPIPNDHIPIGWSKIYAIRNAMQQYPNAKWIFSSETDCMITNMNIKLEDIVNTQAHSNIHILVTADCNGINCGNMMIRNTPIGRAFIDTIIAGEPLYRHCGMFENQLIQDMLVGQWMWWGNMKPGGSVWSDVSIVTRQRVMNSYDYKNLPLLKDRSHYNDIIWGESGQWQEGDFMIQWPATSLEYRINAAKEMFAKLKYDE